MNESYDEFADLDAASFGALQRLSRSLHVREADLDATLQAILTCAVRMIGGARHAGVNLYVRGQFQPQAVFGEPPLELDRVQQRDGVGPCIDASRDQRAVFVSNLRDESPWPAFARRAVELGVLSMLCVPLWVDDVRLGSLSLYGRDVAAFGDASRDVADLLATHAAFALADAQRAEHLRRALANRDLIGQAKGILMERLRITAEEAFRLLAEASQLSNRKLVEVAEELARVGTMATLDGAS